MKIPVSLSCAVVFLSAATAHADLAWTPFAYSYTAADRTKIPIAGQQARLEVSEDRTKPAGPKVSLFLVRLPATTRSPGPPVVYLHGGPGGASLEHLELPEFRAAFDALRTQGDVILLDQRGCGSSLPSLVPDATERFGPDVLATRETFLAFLLHASTTVRDRVLKLGYDPRNFDILASAEDIESLRLALGVPQIRIFAHSYGTQLAQTYLRIHPKAVDRLILAGTRGMDTARKLPSEADAFLARTADLAKRDAAVGAEFQDLLGTLDRVLAKADATPIEVPVEDSQKRVTTYRVGGHALRFIIARFYLNDPDTTRYLPKLLYEIDTGRRPWSLNFNVLQLLRSPVSLAWFTTDAASGASALRARRIATEAKTARVRDALNFPFPDINAVWAMKDLGDAFRESVASNVPALFLTGTNDGITPPAQAREVMKGFSNAHLLVVENAGHISLFRAPGVPAAMAAFLGGATTPDSARLDPVPFVPLIAPRAN